jgi:simple sugar transport system ATP-binding protein
MDSAETAKAAETCPAIECRGITKTFGKVLANDKIDLDVHFGEILALLGENGSGKTTLMNMLSGIYHPDGGSIFVEGKQVHINSPSDSFDNGIGMIHQHFKLVDVLSAMDNIVLGVHEKRLKPKQLKEKIVALSRKFDLQVDPEKKIYNMSVSEKQTVEILKILYRGARILILDEPTAVLTPQETQKLFVILKKMKEDGCAVIIITHKLGEVMQISDRVTILRKGQSIGTVITSETNELKLTELMVGRAVNLHIKRPETSGKKKVLEVKALNACKPDGAKGLIDVNFEMFSGEILGIAGIAGSGQKELCETLTGLMRAQGGTVVFQDENILGKTPYEIQKLGIRLAFVPEDRLGMGLVGSMGMADNMLLKTYKEGKSIFVDRKPAREMAERLVAKLEVQTPSITSPSADFQAETCRKC